MKEKPKLTLVEGTDVPVWDDPNGVERVLNAALGRKSDQVLYGVVATMDQDGSLRLYSNCDNSMIVLGMLGRSLHLVNSSVDANIMEDNE